MIRMLRLLGFAVAIAAAAAWLADHPGRLVMDWQGYRIESSFVFLLGVIVALYCLIRFPAWAYGRWRGTGGQLARLRRGAQALGLGLTAIASGDAPEAKRQAARADRLLGGGPVSLLMQAQAAQLGGDEAAARGYFQTMLAAPETEFLGLRGLLAQAVREGDLSYAGRLADRALRLRPKSPWVLRNKFEIECATGALAQARETLGATAKARLIGKPEQGRRRAILALAEAQQAQSQGAGDQALGLAQEALKYAPDLIPAAILAAQIFLQTGRLAKAERVLEKIWSRAPYPEISSAYLALVGGESPAQKLIRLRRLIAANPTHPESRFVAAEAALAAGETARARELLLPLTGHGVSHRVCMLMAVLAQAQKGDAEEVQHWLARAPMAAEDPAWVCQSCGKRNDAWVMLCPACGEFDSLRWQEGRGPIMPAATAGLLAQPSPV